LLAIWLPLLLLSLQLNKNQLNLNEFIIIIIIIIIVVVVVVVVVGGGEEEWGGHY
jgi:amino acid permease